MDWSNRFTLGGFTVSYATFQMAWEVIEKGEALETDGSLQGNMLKRFVSGRSTVLIKLPKFNFQIECLTRSCQT